MIEQTAVSTHSRPKAAGYAREQGWVSKEFQHTAARRRLVRSCLFAAHAVAVSTHSRPKAAGFAQRYARLDAAVSTHSRPKAAGIFVEDGFSTLNVSTHSRPKAAGRHAGVGYHLLAVSTHSRPKAAGAVNKETTHLIVFQHTAARRRLVFTNAAGYPVVSSFNTQPPEGGWRSEETIVPPLVRFQHTAARRRLVASCFALSNVWVVSTHSRPKAAGPDSLLFFIFKLSFNTQPPEGGWPIPSCFSFSS